MDERTLVDVLAAQSEPLPRRLRVFAGACLAVARLHARGDVVGALVPAGVRVGELGEVAVVAGAGGDRYAAPEHARTAAGDVYALGAMLFELLARQPLHATTADGVAVIGEPRPSRRAAAGSDVPPELDDLAASALVADPAARPTARALADAIHGYLDGDRDLATRTALARDHLKAAQRAFVSADPAVSATAMRDAGRALALDPELAGAAELVTRIMLEPPRAMPPALAATVTADRLATVRRMSRAATIAYVVYLLFAPAFLWLGAGQGRDALALTIIVGLNVAVLARQGFTSAPPRAPLVAIGNAILIGLIARLWSPLMAAPGIAAITTMVSAMSPLYRQRRWVAAMAVMMALAILGPLAAELAGVLSPTMHSVPGGFEITPAGLHLSAVGQYLTSFMFIAALIGASAALGYAIRGGERSLRERLLHIAWQLRQLA
jgi:hypothetical protein|nr:hypothetical protein [Kofleriaceae bacterium]